jgi:DNA-binding NarL/FixJ family response regulator
MAESEFLDPLRVVVIDDSSLMVQSLMRLLELEDWVEVVGTATGVAEAIDLAVHLQPDIALIDVRLPGGGGPALARRIAGVSPDTRMIAFTSETSGATLREMVCAGITGYVMKDAPHEELLRVIHLAGADLAGADLAGADLARKSLARANLAGAETGAAGTAELPIEAEPADPVRLLVAHSDEAVLEALVDLLALDEYVKVVGATADLQTAIDLVRAQHPDVALIDRSIQESQAGKRWEDLVVALRQARHSLRVAAVALVSDSAFVDRLARDGVKSCMITLATARRIRAAVHDAIRNEDPAAIDVEAPPHDAEPGSLVVATAATTATTTTATTTTATTTVTATTPEKPTISTTVTATPPATATATATAARPETRDAAVAREWHLAPEEPPALSWEERRMLARLAHPSCIPERGPR